MSRDHIEFIQSQCLPWLAEQIPTRSGVAAKWLSRDPESGASSMLLRYPPGWQDADAHALDVDEEVFVLQGALAMGTERLGLHAYGYWPAGMPRPAMAAPEGAVVLTFFSGTPHRQAPDAQPVRAKADAVAGLDTISMEWDMAKFDAQVTYLKMGRKNLRVPQDGSGRTYLLGAMPQVFPPSGEEPMERHDYVEESFMISGELALSVGLMQPGAYFWRPPGLWHGGMASATGYLMLLRTPGANAAKNDWSKDRIPVRLDPPYQPILPDSLAPRARPLAPIEY